MRWRMQEEELIRIVDKIANRFASTFKFGYHELEDMKQQAWQVALEGLKDYDGNRPLENFLWTHVRNRLYNFKRDNYFRPEKPCDRCPLLVNDQCTKFKDRLECDLYSRWMKRTEKRKSLMTAVEHNDTNYNENDITTQLDNKHLFDTVDYNMPVELREYWIRFIHNLKLNKQKKEQVLFEITLILKEHNLDSEER